MRVVRRTGCVGVVDVLASDGVRVEGCSVMRVRVVGRVCAGYSEVARCVGVRGGLCESACVCVPMCLVFVCACVWVCLYVSLCFVSIYVCILSVFIFLCVCRGDVRSVGCSQLNVVRSPQYRRKLSHLARELVQKSH